MMRFHPGADMNDHEHRALAAQLRGVRGHGALFNNSDREFAAR